MTTVIKNWVIITVGLHIIAAVWLVALNPESVGQWEAQRDIGYESIWSEYVSDCDCTQPLE